ncbi:MAG: thioredoxin [Candidatus Peregrinibacteria bacterium]
MPQTVTATDFETEVLKSPLPVLVDFYATWCGPCKIMHPVMEELAQDYAGKIKVVKIDVDAEGELASQFNIMSIPTFVFFKDGKPLKSFMGAQPKESVAKLINAVIV